MKRNKKKEEPEKKKTRRKENSWKRFSHNNKVGKNDIYLSSGENQALT